MIKKYFNLPLRSILKQGSQSIISAFGLAIALSCSILILLYIQYELSYDRYHENADQIYRIVRRNPGKTYLGKSDFVVTAGPLKEALVEEIPEIMYSTKCQLRSHIMENNSSLFEEYGILYTDQDFLKIFTFPVISGDPNALNEPFTILLTNEMAIKYFGNEDPIGKTIKADNKYIFTVKGVLQDIPKNSHFNFDFITGFETLYNIRGGKENVEKWGSNSFITYIRLINNANPEDIKDELEQINSKYVNKGNNASTSKIVPEPLKGIHLSGNGNFEMGHNNDIRYLYLISSICLFIILIACFNYMNMAIARSYSRGREIGILKVVGSSRRDLIIQFITESVLLSFGGLIVALILIWFILPDFNKFIDRPLTYSMIFEYSTLIRIIAIMLFAGLFAGIYPALHLSSISPLKLIKDDYKNIGGRRRSVHLRNLLVVFQYIISIVAIISTLTILQQLNFIKSTDPGFVKDNILDIYLRDPEIRINPDILISDFSQNPNIIDVTISADLPITIMSNWSADWDDKSPDEKLNVFRGGIGYNYFDFYNLEIVSGRNFSKDYSSDTVSSILINQKTAKLLGWDDPIGKRLAFNNNTEQGIVVGVFKDFYFHSLHLEIEPLSFSSIGSQCFPYTRYISIKVKSGTISETKQFIEQKLKDLSPDYLNSVSLFSDRLDDMYKTEKKMATLFLFSTVLALILICLGQYSLSSYTTKKRTKEMAIRKVNGAQPYRIMTLLTSGVVKLLLSAILFAWPISYIIMTKWLQNFAFRIEIGITSFIYSFLITLLISLIVISSHVIKLSRVNPAELIRNE